jgi:hypothetical protein
MSSSPHNATSNASSVRWQFIDSSNNSRSNLTQVKRHVMQEYMRQKKGGTRQSESEEEQPRAKRGRPKKTRAAIRKSEKKVKSDDNNSSRLRARRSTRNQSTHREDLIVAVNRDMFGSNPISSYASLSESAHMPSFAPFRPSSAQSHDNTLPLDGFVDVHPQSPPTHDLYFNSISWSTPCTAPYQFMPSPSTMVRDAPIDPFDTLSELDRDGHRVFDPYVNDTSACSYGSHYRSPVTNGYTSDFAPETVKGTVIFQIVLIVHSANTP